VAEELAFSPHLIGVDETGRGPLAGPLLVCACKLFKPILGLNDSKKLSHKKRIELSQKILENSIVKISIVSPLNIDRNGIFPSVMNAMKIATLKLSSITSFDEILIDGPYIPKNMPEKTRAVIKGDGKYQCIASASIVAKVVRDYIMDTYATVYPGYGFERNKGYGTKEHYKAIRNLGVCPIHRRSFRL